MKTSIFLLCYNQLLIISPESYMKHRDIQREEAEATLQCRRRGGTASLNAELNWLSTIDQRSVRLQRFPGSCSPL